MMKPAGAIILMALFASASAATGPDLKKKTNKASAEASNKLYAESALDLTTERLTPEYLGHSCRAIAKRLASFDLKKGEFETTPTYNSRMGALASTTVVGTTLLSDTVGFVPSISAYSPLSQSYDADRGIWKVTGFWHENLFVGASLVSSVKLEYKQKSSRNYEAANAYGRTVAVSAVNWDTCGLAISNSPYSPLDKKLGRIEASFEIGADEARQAKGNVEIMYVGTFDIPYRVDFHGYDKPTIDSPQEYSWTGDALVLKLAQLWIFNRKTGVVYKKIDI